MIDIEAPADASGRVDIEKLPALLKKYKKKAPLLVGSFSAASNLTGVRERVRWAGMADGGERPAPSAFILDRSHTGICSSFIRWTSSRCCCTSTVRWPAGTLLQPGRTLQVRPSSCAEGNSRCTCAASHAHVQARPLFSCSLPLPLAAVNMNPPGRPELAKDAVYLSPHKYHGGPGAPGLLLVKKRLFLTHVPTVPAGGTVAFVSSLHQRCAWGEARGAMRRTVGSRRRLTCLPPVSSAVYIFSFTCSATFPTKRHGKREARPPFSALSSVAWRFNCR